MTEITEVISLHGTLCRLLCISVRGSLRALELIGFSACGYEVALHLQSRAKQENCQLALGVESRA